MDVSIRDLRNHGGEVVERVAHGESVTITRSGRAVARLSPLPGPALSATTLCARRQHLAAVDPMQLRRDIDDTIDASL